MNPTQKAALDQLLTWSFNEGVYSYDDVSAQTTILEGATKWPITYTYTQEEIDSGVRTPSILEYVLKGTIYDNFNI